MSLGKRYVQTATGKAYEFDSIYDAELFHDIYSRRKGPCEIISLEDQPLFVTVYKDIMIEMYPINNLTEFKRK